MGSVKDLIIIKSPENNTSGIGRFVFSDRYSVFDWGEMPDHIKNKGASLCITSAYFFEKLETLGIKTHYRGIVENNKLLKLNELHTAQNIMEISLLRVLKPEIRDKKYDYSIYQKETGNFLIPLEIIYRNSLPEGSSVFKRLKKGEITPEDIGLKKIPQPGERLPQPVIDVSTKLENIDRYITWDKAKTLANLSQKEVDEIKEKTMIINKLITEETEKIGLINEDGKVEFGFNEKREIILVDVMGTLDECRFTYKGIPVSKEILRQYYRKTDWYKEVNKAKEEDRINWKSRVKSLPPSLPEEILNLISNIYQSFANEITGRKWFNSPPLKELLNQLSEIYTQSK